MEKVKADTPIKVIITDDHAIFRKGVNASLFYYKDIQMIAEAENGRQLLSVLEHTKPDIILLDIAMPEMDGIITLSEIRKICPDVKIIMLTMYNDDTTIAHMMEAGANAYLVKDSDPETIYQAIRTCFDNDFYFNDHTGLAILKDFQQKKDLEAQENASPEIQLSEKEIAILKLICEEKNAKEIAEIFEISPRAVEAIRIKLKRRTGAKSLAGLIMYALKSGIIKQP